MAWRVARSLDQLLAEVNERAPNRSKVSDGSIGDAAHASRSSDHNPWITDGGQGIVTARDITDDPKGGHSATEFAEFLRESRDPRIKYVIDNGRMFSSYSSGSRGAWQWGPYNGINAHMQHTHVSVQSSKSRYDDARPWGWADREDEMKQEDFDRIEKLLNAHRADTVEKVREIVGKRDDELATIIDTQIDTHIRRELHLVRKSLRAIAGALKALLLKTGTVYPLTVPDDNKGKVVA